MASSFRFKLKLGSSPFVLAAALSAAATGAVAQTTVKPNASADQSSAVEEVVVTGTSIRGQAPVGSNVMTVDRASIESTGAVDVQQILQTIPALTDFGSSGVGQLAGSSYYYPSIHNLGASGSSSTLALIDGHRWGGGSSNHVQEDPSVLPPIAIARVEVLADGASSTYGSDAVAGVINTITRKNYEGFEAQAQVGAASGFDSRTAGALWGHTWEDGYIMTAFGYSRTSIPAANYSARPFTQPNKTQLAINAGVIPAGTAPSGLTDASNFNCDPATIQMAGQSTIYPNATSLAPVANSPVNSVCQGSQYNNPGNFSGTGAETRETMFVKMSQDIGSRFTFEGDADFSWRDTSNHTSAGTITATVFSTGPQANPFYQKPAGYTGTATSETIRYDATDLLGYGISTNESEDWWLNLNQEYRTGLSDWRVTAEELVAYDESNIWTRGGLNSSAATLALNGTTATGGSTTTPSIAGSSQVVTQLPLTTLNALDVWNPAGSNRTSAATIAALEQNNKDYQGRDQLVDFHLGADGTLFTLPAGDVKLAVGGEYLRITQDTELNNPGNFGPTSESSNNFYFPLFRNIASYFGEANIPVIGPDMQIPLVNKLTFDISGRYDNYNDVGSTANPKLAVEWEVIPGLKVRANQSTSFTAPSQRSTGNPALNGLTSLSRANIYNSVFAVPTSAYPNIIGDPGCPAGSVTCNTDATTVQGIQQYTGNPNTKPERGRAWNVGVDYQPSFLSGFDLSATLFNNELLGGVTSPLISSITSNASLQSRLTFCNPGAPCTQAQISNFIGNTPIVTALPTTTYYLYNYDQTNLFNIYIEGIDLAANYIYPTDTWGNFTAGVSATDFLYFHQSSAGSKLFSVLGTDGYNTTFPSIALQSRFNLGWEYAGFTSTVYANYTAGYHNWSSSTINPIISSGGLPVSGGDNVAANITFDLHVSYDLSNLDAKDLGNGEVYIDGKNIFNREPPFYAGSGYDSFAASNIGRVLSVGIRLKY